MYEPYWDLATRPFEATADRRFYYPCESHQGALLKLRYAVENRKPAAILAGPSGTGKTLLVAMLAQQLEASYRPFVHVVFPQMPGRDLLAYLAEQFGAPPVDQPTGSIEESLRRLEFVLHENTKAGRHAVLAIDEAHLLEQEGTLQTLQLLTNITYEGRHCLTILLVGLGSLIAAVSRLPALDDRAAVKAILRPLSTDETAAYIQHRMAAAGAVARSSRRPPSKKSSTRRTGFHGQSIGSATWRCSWGTRPATRASRPSRSKPWVKSW